jgi:hypothetical protein
MRRLISVAVAAAALVAAAPAAAAERTDDAAKPVVFLSGGELGKVDCQALWKPMKDRLRAMKVRSQGQMLRFGGDFKTVTSYDSDSNCDVTLSGGAGFGVEHQAREFAKWLKANYSSQGQSVDVVAHGTGGVVLRVALAQDPSLLVEDAVTLSAPHAGAKDLSDDCSGRPACVELDTDTAQGKAFVAKLAGEAYANPQGAKGTDWTVMGSAGDKHVSAESALAMDAEHKTTYLDPLTHVGIVQSNKRGNTAKITYSHRGTETFEWRRAPHVADRTGLDLIMGAGGSSETGGGSAGNCTGSNDSGGGVVVEDPGLAMWKSRNKQLSFIRNGIMEAYSDCFVKAGDKLASSTTVRVNGLDITPAPGTVIYIEPKKRWITAEKMSIEVPSQWFGQIPIPLRQDAPLSWYLPKEAGTLSASDIDGFGTGGSTELPNIKKLGKLAGLPVKGLHKLSLGQGYTTLEVNLGIPGIFSGSVEAAGQAQCSNGKDDDRDGKIDHGGDEECKTPNDNYESAADGPGFTTSVRADNRTGLQVDKIAGTVEGNLRLGKIQIGGGASFSYSRAENEWEATLSATIPVPGRAPGLKVGVGVKDGSLKSLSGEATNLGWGPVMGGLYFQRIKIGFVFSPNWEATVGLGLSWGPRIYTSKGPIALVDVDGDITFSSTSLKVAGSLSLLGDKWGSGSLEYKYGSGVTVLADFGKDEEIKSKDGNNKLKVSLKGKFGGTIDDKGVDLTSSSSVCFEGSIKFGPITGSVESTCLAQANAKVTAKKGVIAASVCAQGDLGFGSISIGYATKLAPTGYGGPLSFKGEVFVNSCDFDDWHTAPGAAQAGGTGVTVGSGLDATLIGVSGAGAPPHVALKGPGGETIEAPARAFGIVRRHGHLIIHSPADNTTYVVIGRPHAGRWTVEPQPGSARVTEVRSADALPQPSVEVKVRRKRGRYYLDYEVAPIPGQAVRLRELGANVAATIGEARGRRGTLRLRPALGRGGKRRIVAEVTQDGYPRASLRVGSYRAPKLRSLRASKRVSVSAGGVVRWSRVAGAAGGYVVAVKTSDGRELSYDVKPGTARRVAVRKLAGHTVTRVTVRAMRADGKPGRPKVVRPS